jgi:hypothetical protein
VLVVVGAYSHWYVTPAAGTGVAVIVGTVLAHTVIEPEGDIVTDIGLLVTDTAGDVMEQEPNVIVTV